MFQHSKFVCQKEFVHHHEKQFAIYFLTIVTVGKVIQEQKNLICYQFLSLYPLYWGLAIFSENAGVYA